MMVLEARLERLEEESIDWYDGTGEDEDTSIVDPAMEAAERREAEDAVLVRLHEPTSFNHNQDRQDAVENGWGSLYDTEARSFLGCAAIHTSITNC